MKMRLSFRKLTEAYSHRYWTDPIAVLFMSSPMQRKYAAKAAHGTRGG